MIRTTRLTSGCWVVTEVIPGARSVALGIMVEAGSMFEPPDCSGAAHLLEHLLFRGAVGFDESDLADQLDRLGGDSNAFTDKEVMTAYIRTVPERGAAALELLAAVTQRPLLQPEHIEAERAIVLDELLARDDEGLDVAQLLLDAALFPDHPLGRDVLGTSSSLQSLTAAMLSTFHAATYTAARSVIVGVGAVDHDEVVERAGLAMSDRVAASARPEDPADDRTPSIVTRRHDGGQTHVLLGVRAPGVSDARHLPWSIVTHILGGGVSSRLFRSVRDQLGLAYCVGADLGSTATAGGVSAYCSSAPANMDDVITHLAAALDDLAANGVTAEEFDRSREAIRTDLLLSADEPLARLGRLGYETLLLDGPEEVAARVARLDALSFDDVETAARQLGGAARHGVLVGPSTRGVERRLAKACGI